MNKTKFKKIVSTVALCMALVMCMSFISTLFRAPESGGSSHHGSVQQPTKDPIETETATPVSVHIAYAEKEKTGRLIAKESDLEMIGNTVICNQIVGRESYVEYRPSDTLDVLPLSEDQGIVLDFTVSPGDLEYIPSCRVEFKLNAYGTTLWHWTPSIVQNETTDEPYHVVYSTADGQISIPQNGDTRISYVIYPAKGDDSATIGFLIETYVNGRMIEKTVKYGGTDAWEGVSFEGLRLTFKECSEVSAIRFSDFSVLVFEDIDTSGCYEGSELVNEPTSLNDAFIREFMKDRSALEKIES